MGNKKIRWSKVYESSEEELVDFLLRHNLMAERVTADESNMKMQHIQNTTLLFGAPRDRL